MDTEQALRWVANWRPVRTDFTGLAGAAFVLADEVERLRAADQVALAPVYRELLAIPGMTPAARKAVRAVLDRVAVR